MISKKSTKWPFGLKLSIFCIIFIMFFKPIILKMLFPEEEIRLAFYSGDIANVWDVVSQAKILYPESTYSIYIAFIIELIVIAIGIISLLDGILGCILHKKRKEPCGPSVWEIVLSVAILANTSLHAYISIIATVSLIVVGALVYVIWQVAPSFYFWK